ncbi:hypothetical protein NPA11_00430 [Mycoplasma sp. 1578d]|uniref:hypothetical protein n=1 Tax=Mycoplasma sp. 1578d TaxID=2967299 RepID=UPI00211C02C4|nr:hypothetical protein [Mycoplasma sp. 1578d]UUM19894.1 hypothetical protein NPA11_00430 [Mycoplasma sp. 1578d]
MDISQKLKKAKQLSKILLGLAFVILIYFGFLIAALVVLILSLNFTLLIIATILVLPLAMTSHLLYLKLLSTIKDIIFFYSSINDVEQLEKYQKLSKLGFKGYLLPGYSIALYIKTIKTTTQTLNQMN